MSASTKTDFKRLAELTDEDIDYSDIEMSDEEFWKDAEVVFPSKKIHLSIRLDDDIVTWFKRFGRGYQTKINSVLRSYISSVQRKQAEKSG
jgi:uncharacterized protein (DUF4415 family)